MWAEVGEGSKYHHNTFYEILKELINNKYWRNGAALSPWYLSVWESSHLSSFFSSDVAFLCDSWLSWQLQSTISQTSWKITEQASAPAAPSAGLLPQMSSLTNLSSGSPTVALRTHRSWLTQNSNQSEGLGPTHSTGDRLLMSVRHSIEQGPLYALCPPL